MRGNRPLENLLSVVLAVQISPLVVLHLSMQTKKQAPCLMHSGRLISCYRIVRRTEHNAILVLTGKTTVRFQLGNMSNRRNQGLCYAATFMLREPSTKSEEP